MSIAKLSVHNAHVWNWRKYTHTSCGMFIMQVTDFNMEYSVAWWRGMWVWRTVYLTHKRLRKVCIEYVNIWVHWVCACITTELNKKRSLPEQEVSVSVATTEEQPGLAKRGLRVLLPLRLSESQTADVSGQSIPTDDQTRWRRGSPSSQQRLKKSSDTIKHFLQWQYTECHDCLMHGNDCACCKRGHYMYY